MELGWAAAIQAVLVCISTYYVRRGGKKDAEGVKRSTASQSTTDEILVRVRDLEHDVALIRRVVFYDKANDPKGLAK